MKPFLMGLGLFVVQSAINAQCPTTPITLGSQADIDNFSIDYPNCTQLNDALFIDELDGPIDNLEGLSQLISGTSLNIQYTHISDFSGLENLTQLDQFRIFRNDDLLDFSGFESLVQVTSFNAIQNNSLSTSVGLDALESVTYLNFYENEVLSDLTAFSNVTELSSFRIAGNNFTSLAGMENLTSVSEELFISGESITDVSELTQVFSQFNGSLYFINNTELQDLSACSGLNSLDGLVISGCSALTNLNGLEDLVQVNDLLRIGFNSQLESLVGLEALTFVKNLDIYENSNLTNLSGLQGLESIQESLYIMDNPMLSDITALDGLSAESLSQMAILRNTNLSVCDNNFVCQVIFDPEINEQIQGNANGCNSVPQVAARCILGADELSDPLSVEIWPNPTNAQLSVLVPAGEITGLEVFNAQGQLIDSGYRVSSEYPQTVQVNVSNYPTGLYFISLMTNRGMVQQKFIKH